MRFDDKAIAEAKAKHGAIYCVELDGDEFYFRPPTMLEYSSFLKVAMDEDTRHTAMRQLVRDVIVLPPRDEYDAMLANAPGMSESIAAQVLKVSTRGKATEAKKV